MITEQELGKYACNISIERLKSFVYQQDDNINDVIARYADNIKISQSLYPELAVLEVSLRNAVDTALKSFISENWIEDEVKNNVWLDTYDYNTLVNAYNNTKQDCILNKKTFSTGKVIANLNFGFWTNICVKKYNSKIWNKRNCFKAVFPNYTSKKLSINIISQQLYIIRRLRNRVFHYEQIFKNPKNTLSLYNEIMNLISYLPGDNFSILKKTSSFLKVYNSLANNQKPGLLCDKPQ